MRENRLRRFGHMMREEMKAVSGYENECQMKDRKGKTK